MIRCDDGLVRDLQAVFGKYKMDENTEDGLEKILDVLELIDPGKFVMFFDKQVSKSGELSEV